MTESLEQLTYENCTLDPEHYLLESFQKALKEHLLTQIQRTKEEIAEIEGETVKKKSEYEKIGVRVYENQHLSLQRQEALEEVIESLKKLNETIQKEQDELQENKNILKDVEEKLFNAEKTNREYQNEIQSLKLLTSQMSQYENKIEENIIASRVMTQKQIKENKHLSEEKKKQDLLIYKINKEVWDLESEIENMNHIMQIKENEVEEYETKIASLNTTAEALQTEHNALLFSWHTVCVDITHRDKKLECLTQKLNNIQTKFSCLETETNQVKKLVKKEFFNNQVNTARKERIEKEVEGGRIEIKKRLEEKEIMEQKMFEMQTILDQTLQDIAKVKEEYHSKELSNKPLQKKFDKLNAIKLNTENEIVQILKKHTFNDQSCKKYTRLLQEKIIKRKDVQIKLEELESKKRAMDVTANLQKLKNFEYQEELDNVKVHVDELTKIYKDIKISIEKYEFIYSNKNKYFQDLTSKLEYHTKQAKDNRDEAARKRVRELESILQEIQISIRELQHLWITEQNNLLRRSSERQKQIDETNKLRKQINLQDQQHLRCMDELDNLEKLISNMNRKIQQLYCKLCKLSENCYLQKSKKIDLNSDNLLLQSSFANQLRDAEMELLKLESEIADIEDDKLTISKQLIATNREGLEWEKLCNMARDAIRSTKDTKELLSRRSEINKMKETFMHLRKVQKKMVHDMTLSLSLRDNLYYMFQSENTSKKTRRPSNQINHTRLLANTRNKIKKHKNIVIHFSKETQEIQEKMAATHTKLQEKKTLLQSCKDNVPSNKQALEEAKINRELKFNLLVLHQKKLIFLQQIFKSGEPTGFNKKYEQLEKQYCTEKETNVKLSYIAEKLKEDFPERVGDMTRICNHLGIVLLMSSSII